MYLFKSTVIETPVEEVWLLLRRFDSVAEWSTAVSEASIEDGGPPDRVGCIRKLLLPDGGVFRETLVALSDLERSFSYDILDSPLPVTGYVATQSFKPAGAGRTFAAWEVHFDTPDAEREAMRHTVGVEIFESGLADMKRHFEAGA